MVAWSGYPPQNTVTAAPAAQPSIASPYDAGWKTYATGEAVSSDVGTSTTSTASVDANWEPYTPGGGGGGSSGNLPPPLTQFQINQIVTAMQSGALTQAQTLWLQSLPTDATQSVPQWWNNNGIPVFS